MDQTSALDLHVFGLGMVVDRTDLLFECLGGSLTDKDIVIVLDVFNYCLVEAVAAHLDCFGNYYASEGYYRDLGDTAAYINSHIAFRCFYVNTDSDS